MNRIARFPAAALETTTPTTPEAATLLFRPAPTRVRCLPHRTPKGDYVTAIFREWEDGDSGPEGRCRLCARCTASGGICSFVVDGLFDKAAAADFSPDGFAPSVVRIYGNASDGSRVVFANGVIQRVEGGRP